MIRNSVTAWAALLLGVSVLPGCNPHFTQGLAPVGKPTPLLPITPRFPIDPDVSALPTVSGQPVRPAKYRNLTANECRLLAIHNAPFADDLDQHPDNQTPKHPHYHKKKAETSRVSSLVRGHTADELRNRAAGDALEQYFQLARAEGQFDLLVLAHLEVAAHLDAAKKAEESGLKDRAGIDAIRTQLLDLEARLARLDATIGQLNASLRARLNIDPRDPLPLWPDDPLRVRPDEVDAEQAVATGLHYRPDLNALRVLATEDGTGADDLRRQVLSGLNPLLAIGSRVLSPLMGSLELLSPRQRVRDEAARRNLQAVLVGRERQADAEIRAAVLDLQGHRAVAIARAADVRRLGEVLATLEKRQHAGQQVTAELTNARLELLKARGELLAAATDWNITEVKLRQAMGILVRE